MRKSVVATVDKTLSNQVFIHFCSTNLQGVNANLRFPLHNSTHESLDFVEIENILMLNRIANNVTSITKIRSGDNWADFEIVFNAWVNPDKENKPTPKSPNTIAALKSGMIAEINDYLTANNQKAFTDQEITFIECPYTSDPLGLLDAVRFVKGDFLDNSKCDLRYMHEDINGKDYDDLTDEYASSLNREDYSDDDYQSLIKEAKAEFKASIIKHALILTTTNNSTVELLLLNSDMKPLNIITTTF